MRKLIFSYFLMFISISSCRTKLEPKFTVLKLDYYDSSCSEIYEFFETKDIYLVMTEKGTYYFSPHKDKFTPYEGNYEMSSDWDAHVSVTYYLR